MWPSRAQIWSCGVKWTEPASPAHACSQGYTGSGVHVKVVDNLGEASTRHAFHQHNACLVVNDWLGAYH